MRRTRSPPPCRLRLRLPPGSTCALGRELQHRLCTTFDHVHLDMPCYLGPVGPSLLPLLTEPGRLQSLSVNLENTPRRFLPHEQALQRALAAAAWVRHDRHGAVRQRRLCLLSLRGCGLRTCHQAGLEKVLYDPLTVWTIVDDGEKKAATTTARPILLAPPHAGDGTVLVV